MFLETTHSCTPLLVELVDEEASNDLEQGTKERDDDDNGKVCKAVLIRLGFVCTELNLLS